MSDELRLAEIESWFHDRGLRLLYEERQAGGFRVYVAQGNAQLTVTAAETRLDAAQAARASFDKIKALLDSDPTLYIADLRDAPVDFLVTLGSITAALLELLDRPPPEGTPLYRFLTRLEELHGAGRIEERDLECARLSFLVKHLAEVRSCDPSTADALARRLNSSDENTYYGARQEIVVAASLARKGLEFEFEPPGGPDFNVMTQDGPIGIECTSAHIPSSEQPLYVIEPGAQPPEKDFAYKLARAIRQKARKSYASASVALAVDATNLYALSGSSDLQYEQALEALGETTYGAAIVFCILANRDVATNDGEVQFQSNYRRLDGVAMSPPLRRFIETHFPLGDLRVERYATPWTP